MNIKANILYHLTSVICGCFLLIAAHGPAAAQSPNYCYLQNPFAAPQSYIPFAVCRGGGCSRRHKGNDMMYCEGANIPIQSGAGPGGGEADYCNIMYNGASNPIWMNGGGYGLYMRFDCGNGIETRMAHLQGYNANSKTVINGRTGNAWTTPPHVHYEIYVNKKAVDPECALGVADPKNKCPPLPPGPANLCDPQVLSILHADAAAKLRGTSPGTSMGIGPSHPPSHWPSGIYGDPCNFSWQGGPPQCSDPSKQCEKVEERDGKVINPETGEEYDMGEEGEHNPGGETIKGTGIRTGTGEPIVPGKRGGGIKHGTPGPEGRIPPIKNATGGEHSSCALDTWVALSNQSALEARRETAMNKRFIAKADSVLDYGCFNYFLNFTQNDIAGIFSESDMWVGRMVDIKGKTITMNKTLGSTSMDSALQAVVWNADQVYKQSFDHPMMGGLEGYSVKPQPFPCENMKTVWKAAQCQNFPAAEKVFLTFSELISKDPREFPETLKCNFTAINQGMIDAAKNKVTKYDPVEPRFDYLKGDGDCKSPIPTGITIYRHQNTASGSYIADISTYQDAVCSNAGCYYDNAAMSGTGECKKN